MRYALTVALVGILSLAAGAASADDTVPLASGTRVRVTVPTGGGRLVGTVVAVDDKSLTLRVSGKSDNKSITSITPQVSGKTDTTVLRREEISRLFVSEGRGSRGRAALIGAAYGAGASAVLGLAAGSDPPESFIRLSAAAKAALFCVVLVPIGALIGAGNPGERWKELPTSAVHLSLAPARGRGASVSMAFVF